MQDFDAQVSIVIKDFSFKGKLSDIAKINIDRIDAEMCRQPELVSWFGVASVEALTRTERIKNELSKAKEDLNNTYARLDLMVRDGTLAGGVAKEGKKPTEKEIEATVLTHQRYLDAQALITQKRTELLDANDVFNKLLKIMDALEHKRDMLIQLSANRRKELVVGDYHEPENGKTPE